jgi:hypothetical protein
MIKKYFHLLFYHKYFSIYNLQHSLKYECNKAKALLLSKFLTIEYIHQLFRLVKCNSSKL